MNGTSQATECPGRAPRGRAVRRRRHPRRHQRPPRRRLARGFPAVRPRQAGRGDTLAGGQGRRQPHPVALPGPGRGAARGDRGLSRRPLQARLSAARDALSRACARCSSGSAARASGSSSLPPPTPRRCDYYLSLIACADLVEAKTSKDDVDKSKPCPDIFAAALARVAPLGAGEVAVVGDTPWDAKAAGKPGCGRSASARGGFPTRRWPRPAPASSTTGPRQDPCSRRLRGTRCSRRG